MRSLNRIVLFFILVTCLSEQGESRLALHPLSRSFFQLVCCQSASRPSTTEPEH